MLVDNDINPKKSLYYIGYLLLDFIKKGQKYLYKDIEELYEMFLLSNEEKIQFSKFLLLIDWLYINDIIRVKGNGEIVFNVFN